MKEFKMLSDSNDGYLGVGGTLNYQFVSKPGF